MSSRSHAVVWVDHQEARVFHFDAEQAEHLVIHPHNHHKTHLHHKAGSIGSGHAKEDHDFLQHVAQAVSDASAILITGAGGEKTALVKHIEAHMPGLKSKIRGVQPLNHPTDGELVAHARKFFAADNQMPPRMT